MVTSVCTCVKCHYYSFTSKKNQMVPETLLQITWTLNFLSKSASRILNRIYRTLLLYFNHYRQQLQKYFRNGTCFKWKKVINISTVH